MGWSFRKSYKAGPIRINISKSGIGYSIGTKGFRIGNGPRGRYVRMGAHGIYYYAKLKDPSDNQEENSEDYDKHSDESYTEMEQISDNIILDELSSDGCIGFLDKVAVHTQIIDKIETQFNGQLRLANEKREKLTKEKDDKIQSLKDKFFKDYSIFFIIPFIGCCVAFSYTESGILIPFFPIIIVAYYYLKNAAIGKKARLIEKKFNDNIKNLDKQENILKEKYSSLVKSNELRIYFAGRQIDFLKKLEDLFKSTPQSGELVRMKPVSTNNQIISDEYVKTGNVSFNSINPGDYLSYPVPTINVGNRILYFFPQGLLIEDSGEFAEMDYGKISIERYENRLTVTKRPQKDAIIVGETWEHTRVDGTPDRRYKENAHFFIVKYFGVKIFNVSFLSKPIYFSCEESANSFINKLNNLLKEAPVR